MTPAETKKPANIADVPTPPLPASPAPSSLSPASPSPAEARKPYTASAVTVHTWGASGIAQYFMWKEFAIIPQVYNMFFGMDTRLVAWVMAAPRFLDSVLDPVLGHLSDNTNTRWGRRRPFMFASAILGALLVLGMYWVSPDWSKTWQFVYLLIAVVLFYAVWGIYEMSRNALSYELSDDYGVRSRIQAIGSVWFSFPMIIGSATYMAILQLSHGGDWSPVSMSAFKIHWAVGLGLWLGASAGAGCLVWFLATRGRGPLLRRSATAGALALLVGVPAAAYLARHWAGQAWQGAFSGTWDFPGFKLFTIRFPDLGSPIKAVRTVAMACAGIILIFGLIPTFVLKERFQSYNRTHVSLWKAFGTTMRNRPFILVILLRLAQTLGSTLYSTMSFYIGVFCVCGGDQVLYSGVTTIGGAWVGFVFSLLIWPLAVPITRKIGKRWGLVLGFGMALVSSLTLPLVTRQGWVWVVFAHSVFFMPWGSIQGMFMASIMPDICDLDELASGERREGLYAAVFTFINKLEISVCQLASGYLLYWAGFDSDAVSKGIKPPSQVLSNLLWWGFTPLIFFAAVAFVIAFFNPLTPKAMEKVHAELEARRAQSHLVDPEKA